MALGCLTLDERFVMLCATSAAPLTLTSQLEQKGSFLRKLRQLLSKTKYYAHDQVDGRHRQT